MHDEITLRSIVGQIHKLLQDRAPPSLREIEDSLDARMKIFQEYLVGIPAPHRSSLVPSSLACTSPPREPEIRPAASTIPVATAPRGPLQPTIGTTSLSLAACDTDLTRTVNHLPTVLGSQRVFCLSEMAIKPTAEYEELPLEEVPDFDDAAWRNTQRGVDHNRVVPPLVPGEFTSKGAFDVSYLNLTWYPHLGELYCTNCESIIPARWAYTHAQKHKLAFQPSGKNSAKSWKARLLGYAETRPLPVKPRPCRLAVNATRKKLEVYIPVGGIPVLDGIRCTLCGFCVTSGPSAHFRDAHPGHMPKGNTVKVRMQALLGYANFVRNYYEVDDTRTASIPLKAAVANLERDLAKQDIYNDCAHPHPIINSSADVYPVFRTIGCYDFISRVPSTELLRLHLSTRPTKKGEPEYNLRPLVASYLSCWDKMAQSHYVGRCRLNNNDP